MTMGLTGLGGAAVRSLVGDGPWQELVSNLIYPVGFIAVIIGPAQLFTENTLYPVVLVLAKRHHLVATLRLWGSGICIEPCRRMVVRHPGDEN
jgi:formate/nitrite transporter FocA (FNT family)